MSVRMPGRPVETRRIRSDAVVLHVEVEGPEDGTPVAFLHGVGSSARTWEWLPDELTRGRRIIRVDLRGHGRSAELNSTALRADYLCEPDGNPNAPTALPGDMCVLWTRPVPRYRGGLGLRGEDCDVSCLRSR